MPMSLKGAVVGTLALAGAVLASIDAEAMPVQPLSPGASTASVEQIYYYGYRRPYVRPFVRPFYGYRRFGYGYRRPFVYRRPFYRYGYRRY